MSEDNRWRKNGEKLRRQSMALAIPSLILGGPLGVGAVGYFIGKHFGDSATGFFVGFVLGLIVAVWESAKILRAMAREDETDSKK